jgi:RNA polymerase sigma-70 factor (ECF subfamily)
MVMDPLKHPRATISSWGDFSDSYRYTMPIVYRYLYRGTAGDVQLAEDLTQATFEIAVRAFGQGHREALEPAWLQTVARSRLIDHYRRSQREKTKLALIARRRRHDVGLPGEISAAEARAALEALCAQHRLALVLRYLDDLTVAEVARVLGKSLRATESLLVRARAALRAAYEEHCDAC